MLAVQQIDRALKRLYNIESSHCAEDFLIFHKPIISLKNAGSKDLSGALFIRGADSLLDDPESSLDLGIYLSSSVRETLHNFHLWVSPWSVEQLNAFCVACEEVSHFHYLLYNVNKSRPISQFELELQGEVDKFVLSLFSHFDVSSRPQEKFEFLMSQLFEQFRLISSLEESQRRRYLEANCFARRFVQKLKKYFSETHDFSKIIHQTRRFYQSDLATKMSSLL